MSEATIRGDDITLPGESYWLRTLNEADVTERYVSWLRDAEVTRFLDVRFGDHSQETVTAFVRSFDNKTSYLFGIFARDSGEHVGNIALRIDSNHRTGWHGTMIGDKRYWGRNAYIEAHEILSGFAFGRLQLRKLYAGVNVRHTAARFNLRRLGYAEEARLKDHLVFEGELVDCSYYSLFQEAWRARGVARRSQ